MHKYTHTIIYSIITYNSRGKKQRNKLGYTIQWEIWQSLKRWTDEHQIGKGAWNTLLIKYNLKVCIYFDTEL